MPSADIYGALMGLSALERATHYRQEAEHCRRMAGAEPRIDLRPILLNIANLYDDLASPLVSEQDDGT
jgi:hypothetical protein